jgi:hypothetical protein
MRNGRGGVRLHLAGPKHRRRGRERRSSPGDRMCSRLPALAVPTEASEPVWCSIVRTGSLWVASGEDVLVVRVSVVIT